MPTNGGGNGGGGGNAAQQQFELLGAIQILNFAASPNPVKPFGTTTISWTVKFPSHLQGQVTIIVAGNEVSGQSPGTLSGSATVTVDHTRQFGLAARGTLVSRGIGSLTVLVEESECKVGLSFPSFIVTNKIKDGIRQAVAGRLRDDESFNVTIGLDVIFIAFVLDIRGQDTLDVSMELQLFKLQQRTDQGDEVGVSAQNVTANMHLSGVASLCEGLGSQVAQVFLTEIANNQLALAVQQGITAKIQADEASAKTADNLHRDFALTSFQITADQATYTICPNTPGT